MTHITDARFIGNHAEMGGSARAAARIPLTAAGHSSYRSRPQGSARREMIAERSTWDSEGGATGKYGTAAQRSRGPRTPWSWFLTHLSSALSSAL